MGKAGARWNVRAHVCVYHYRLSGESKKKKTKNAKAKKKKKKKKNSQPPPAPDRPFECAGISGLWLRLARNPQTGAAVQQSYSELPHTRPFVVSAPSGIGDNSVALLFLSLVVAVVVTTCTKYIHYYTQHFA